MKEIRLQEITALFYRIFLAFVFYQIARLLFWFFNKSLIRIDSVSDYFNIAYHGTAFDTRAFFWRFRKTGNSLCEFAFYSDEFAAIGH